MKRSSWFLRLGLVVAACLAASGAAADPSAADKETARSLLVDGRTKLIAKDYEGALKSLQGAHAIMGVPTTGLELARVHEAMGHLLEAREAALAVGRTAAAAGESPAFADARKAAEELAAKIAPRIPSVVLVVKGLGPEAASVKIDGVPVTAATLGLPRKTNPGQHKIEVSAPGYETAVREVALAEGETRTVELVLAASGSPAASGTVTATAAPVVPPVPSAPASASGSASASASATASAAPSVSVAPPPSGSPPAWAWVAGGVGLVAVGVGAAFFVDYLGVRDTVARDCPGNVCDPGKRDADSAQSLRAQWNRDLGLTVGLGGLALAGAGVAVFGFASPPASARVRPGARLWLTPSGAGLAVKGAF
jgi:hypothetical protein